MAAGQVMSHATTSSTTNNSANLNPQSTSQKRYSFLDQLDNLALDSPELSFAPSTSTSRRVDDETIRRLSASLQNLLSQKHGDNQLPELPIPTYDNGNVDLVAVHATTRSSPATSLEIPPESTDLSHRPKSGIPVPVVPPSRTVPRFKPQSLQKQVLKRNSDVLSDFEELHATRSVPQLSRSRNVVESPRESCYGSNARESRPSRSNSSRVSRPTSTCNVSNATRAQSCSKPAPVPSQITHGPHHKKATSYSEQRFNFNPPALPESLKAQGRRRFRLIPSFKDLHAHTKTQSRRPVVEEPSVEHDSPDSTSSQLISLHDALRGSIMPLPPLHDPHHDQQFTMECKEMLDLKPDSRGRGPSKRLIPRLGPVTQEADTADHQESLPSMRHGSTASEALTVGTSIFDLDWPQPSTYTTLTPEVYQRQKAAITRRSAPPISGYETKHKMMPSPPPTYPLPPVPDQSSESIKRQRSRRSPTRKNVDTSITMASMNQTIATTATTMNKKANRVTALAASKGLQVDANLNSDGSSNNDYPQEPVTGPEPYPLNARFMHSKRNSRVHELKKKHLSMLVKDMPIPTQSEVVPQASTRPESYLSGSATPLYSTSRAQSQNKLLSLDKRKQSYMLPDPARYNDNSQDPACVTKANIGKSRNAKPTSSTSQQSHQISGLVSERSLAHSGVMVMVDSSPKKSRDFRAGAIKVTTPPRRRVSINKTQISAPLPCQPDLRNGTPPVTSASTFVDSQKPTTLLIGVNTVPHPSSSALGSRYLAPPRLASGLPSPSKASSILEPGPLNIPSRGREAAKNQNLPERPHTPIQPAREDDAVPAKRQRLRLFSPSTRRHISGPSDNASRQGELDLLHAEIDRMVRMRKESKARRDLRARPKLSFADRYENEKMPTSGLHSLSMKSPRSFLSRFDTASRSLRSTTSATKNLHIYDDSDMSITPKSSFRSTSSESSRGCQRKNSDSSLTDPTEYDEKPPVLKPSRRVFILPSPTLPEEEDNIVDTTYIKSRKKYSNMPTCTDSGRAVQPTASWFDYIMNHQPVVAPLRTFSASTRKTSENHRPSDDIELNHFLTEADEMDDAIDSFQQSQTPPSIQLAPGTQMRSLLSQDNRRSAVSNIVELQRIQDQVNGSKEFGRISLMSRPRTS